jgi:anti-sigma28 factor (negative regulator of flagellin synthesis)
MKVKEASPVSDVARVASPEQQAAQPPKDRVTVSQSREVKASASAAQASAASGRSARLKDLEQQVRAGSYHPDPTRVAEEILQEAELEARLQTILRP